MEGENARSETSSYRTPISFEVFDSRDSDITTPLCRISGDDEGSCRGPRMAGRE